MVYTSSPELRANKIGPIKYYNPYIGIFAAVLDQNGFSRTEPGSNYSIKANPAIVKSIIDAALPSLPSNNPLRDVPVPADFGIEAVRAGVRETISLLRRSGAIPTDLIVATARFARPRSTIYTKGDTYHFYHGSRIEITDGGLKQKAGYVATCAERTNTPLSNQQILGLALVDGIAHEYGHALHRAVLPEYMHDKVRVSSTPTLEKARQKGFIRDYEVLKTNIAEIHDEHIAEGVRNIAVEEYLNNTSLTEEQKKKFLSMYNRYEQGAQVFDFYNYAKEKGYSPEEIGRFTIALFDAAWQNYPDLFLFRLDRIVSYHTQPYSRDQLKVLLEQDKLNLRGLLQRLDKVVEGMDGVKPSEAWEFRERVRVKYGLPEPEERWNDPVSYIHRIEDLLRNKGVDLRSRHEFEPFFRELPESQGVTFNQSVFRDATTVVLTPASENDFYALCRKADHLAHEAVHAMQEIYTPRMPDELAEREAYYYQMLMPFSFYHRKDYPEAVMDLLNGLIEKNVQKSVEGDKKIKGLIEEN